MHSGEKMRRFWGGGLLGRYAKDALMPSDKTRIFVCSDIHVDQHGNISWCQKMNPSEFINDVLLVAGDCGDTMNAIKQVRASSRPRCCTDRLTQPHTRRAMLAPPREETKGQPDEGCWWCDAQTVT
jgi:hypothetical protein